jgi:AAA15 family ATPase/GTPase
MLISFSVENFRSIRDLQTLSLESQKSDGHLLCSNTVELPKRRLGKVAAVFGPNGSGKSNLIKAMIWFRQFVLASSKEGQAGEKIAVEPFLLSDSSEGQASHFEIEFFWKDFEYRYGFTATRDAIESEWLFRRQPGSKPARLFTREGGTVSPSAEFFKEGKGLESRTRSNALFLSVCGQFAGPEAEKILLWFRQFRNISGLDDRGYLPFTAERLCHELHRSRLLEFAQQADFNIVDLASEELSEEKLPKEIPADLRKKILSGRAFGGIKTYHHKRNASGEVIGRVEFDLNDDESEGTQKFIALSGPITHTLEEGSILVIDELEARLHPKLTQAIVDLFHSPVNEKNAQLICATHDVTLLDPERFRRDQIWFCEKGSDGSSTLFSLAEFDPQKVRPTTKFSRQYMLGLFGAIPKLAHFQEAPAHAVQD